jgi:hypothetical protein
MAKVTVYEDQMNPNDRLELELPLTSKVDFEELRKDIGVPEWVDTGYFHMKRAVAILWASQNVTKLNDALKNSNGRIRDKPINLVLFGGGAFKMHCPSSNIIGSPLNRPVNDVDFVMESKRSGDVKKLLLSLGTVMGTQYTHFMTRLDRRWTALRGGKRILVRALDVAGPDESPRITSMDIIADKLELCHTMDLREAVGKPKENLYTIGLANLLLSKCQFITMVQASELAKLKGARQDFRVLNHEALNEGRVAIGMESKDMKDVCALLLDHEFGGGNDELSLSSLRRILERDEKLALTVRLNLQNIRRNQTLIASWGLSEDALQSIGRKLEALLSAMQEPKKKYSKPWWNTDVETPKIHL